MLVYFANQRPLIEETASGLTRLSPTATPRHLCFVLHFSMTPGFWGGHDPRFPGGHHPRSHLSRTRDMDYPRLYRTEVVTRRDRIETRLTFKYDRAGDILYIDKTRPYPEQETEELGDDVIARLNPTTREIENLEVLFFSTRLLRSDLFELPVIADMRLVA